MRRYAKERAEDQIATLAGRGLDLKAFWDESAEAVSSVIPHMRVPCWFTLDPASLLVTSHYDHGLIPEFPPEWLAREYYDDDVQDIAAVARSERGISTLHEAAGGDPSGSPRWQANMQMGGDQELLVALRTPTGEAWGLLALYREPGEPQFQADELAFLRVVAPLLAQGARQALLLGEASEPEGPEPPGLVVLNEDWSIDSLTPGAERWLRELSDDDWQNQNQLPPSVLAVAGRALRTAEGEGVAGEVAVSRVLSSEGRWMILHGAALVAGGGGRRVAVIVEPAHPARITPLLMAAYSLTDREQEVTRLVLCGDSTAQLAERLCVSPHTVQQHLKSVFEKTGVRSRRDLVGKVFFTHYEPRVRDNERRAAQSRPLRGGPMPPEKNAGAEVAPSASVSPTAT
jgi:DNA-binding CsgD family transcriptional regulator